jgi:hypothetical protein
MQHSLISFSEQTHAKQVTHMHNKTRTAKVVSYGGGPTARPMQNPVMPDHDSAHSHKVVHLNPHTSPPQVGARRPPGTAWFVPLWEALRNEVMHPQSATAASECRPFFYNVIIGFSLCLQMTCDQSRSTCTHTCSLPEGCFEAGC